MAERRDLREAWGRAAKMRATASFDIKHMVDKYALLYEESLNVN
jgi:hypothetical protein